MSVAHFLSIYCLSLCDFVYNEVR